MPLNQQDPWSARGPAAVLKICTCPWSSHQLWRGLLCFMHSPGACHLHLLSKLLSLFLSSPSSFSQISSLASVIKGGGSSMNDLSHLIQWQKYETFIIYSAHRTAKDKFTCDTCIKINSYLFLVHFHYYQIYHPFSWSPEYHPCSVGE